MSGQLQLRLDSLQHTRQLACRLAKYLRAPLTIALIGDLGTGKTQLVRFFAEALGMAAEDVTSPTYVLQQRYPTSPVIHHFDFYRLESPTAVWDLGIDELYEEPGFVFIEWADKFPECWPERVLIIELEPLDSGGRLAKLQMQGAPIDSIREWLVPGE